METTSAIERWRGRVLARRRQVNGASTPAAAGDGPREHRVYARRLHGLAREWEPSGLLTDLLRRHVGPDATVVDVGAGTGRYTLPLATMAGRVIAVEPSPTMMGYLRGNLAARGVDNVVLLAERWETAEVPVADFALCSHVLYDVLEVGCFLRKLDERSRRGCFIVHHREQFHQMARDLWPLVHGEEVVPMPLFDQLLEVLEEIGIEGIQTGVMPPPFRIYFTSLEEVVEYALETLTLEESEQNRALLSRAVVPLVQQVDGRFYLRPQPASGVVWWLK